MTQRFQILTVTVTQLDMSMSNCVRKGARNLKEITIGFFSPTNPSIFFGQQFKPCEIRVLIIYIVIWSTRHGIQ